ncbi:hypothetical protein NM688_g1647 [Phlebia brevispora]|uniref:Uncharacterized protein n=1 Tax=Phlebia brevispora TaxID=194682 RepID=A0ACC1TAX1_9APHY|nr:hypothetical protein NM688_g1647 [Phlebia brevispora]
MHLSPVDTALNMQLTPMDADLHTYGFPAGYFIIRNVATNKLLDVEAGRTEDGTPIILYNETETSLVEDMRSPGSNNQASLLQSNGVFFIDTSGALCSRSSGHAIDIQIERMELRHRRPVSHPFPNAYSHPLPRFSYDAATRHIVVTFAYDPSYPTSAREEAASAWKDKVYLMTSIPMRKPWTIMNDASELLTSAISAPFTLLSGRSGSLAKPDEVFDSGDIDLREDEILEQDRSEEGEVDDSPDKHREVRVIGTSKEDEQSIGEKAKARRQWVVVPLRTTRRITGHTDATFGQHHLHSDLNAYRDEERVGSVGLPGKPHADEWLKKYGPQIDQPFSGPLSFSHLTYSRCLEDASATFDIAVLGMPFDTAVTYRSGARFGPYAIRSGSRRQRETRGYTLSWKNNPYALGSRIIDCGDVPVSPFDNALAVDQMEVAYSSLLARPVVDQTGDAFTVAPHLAKDGKAHPRIVTLGGDHTIVLPILRSLNKVYGPVSVIHFDAHLDTWPAYPGQSSEQSRVTHGTFFYLAHEEKLMTNTSVHAGIRCKLTGVEDLTNDENVGFQLISTDDIDDYGVNQIIRRIRERIGDSPVYLSLDIDVIDPGLAPATGAPEAGGWTTREVKRIIRGLAGLNFVGADIVEVAPAYDNAEITGIAAADLVHDFLSMFLTKEPPKPHKGWVPSRDEL